MLPAAAARWSEERLRVVISHELAHVRRGDWGTQLAAELLRAVFWFNPLVWIACRRLRAESELACDDEVLNGGVEGVDYAGHLLDLARVLNSPRHAWLSAPAMARPSSLEGRISAMLNADLNRHPVTRAARAVTCALVLGLTLAVAGFAQSTYYTFSGTVVDSTDRVVPGVDADAHEPEPRRALRNQDGRERALRVRRLAVRRLWIGSDGEGFKPFKEMVAIAGQRGESAHRAAGRPGAGDDLDHGQRRPGRDRHGRSGFDAAAIAADASEDARHLQAERHQRGRQHHAAHEARNVRPIYPAELSAANIGGTVTMEATIDTDGMTSRMSPW